MIDGIPDPGLVAPEQVTDIAAGRPIRPVCGSEEQKQRWLPAMARLEQIGAFGLTEPDSGSDVARGMSTTATRDGSDWILNGSKKWIGNASFADLTIIWARNSDDNAVLGFVVEKDTAGFDTADIPDKIALRVVQNANITLTDVRAPEENRRQEARTFRDAADVLRMTRAGVAWSAVGCARGAYEHALRYAGQRRQSVGRLPGSSWCRICSSRCWATSPPRQLCACGCPNCRTVAR